MAGLLYVTKALGCSFFSLLVSLMTSGKAVGQAIFILFFLPFMGSLRLIGLNVSVHVFALEMMLW